MSGPLCREYRTVGRRRGRDSDIRRAQNLVAVRLANARRAELRSLIRAGACGCRRQTHQRQRTTRAVTSSACVLARCWQLVIGLGAADGDHQRCALGLGGVAGHDQRPSAGMS